MNTHTSFEQGAIATPHHLATQAGARALKEGGNAIDAALAAAATLCVVYPNNTGLGGDLVALVRNPDGEIRVINATGPTPKAQSREALRAKHGEELPLRGIDTVTVPGGVCGWNSLHEYGAKLPWQTHFTEAITLAEQGFPNSRSVAEELVAAQKLFAQDPGAREIFYPDGKPLAEGEPLVQPALARTLRALAKGGSAEFYEGETAKAWIRGANALGSPLSLTDAHDYQAQWEAPIETTYDGLRVLTSAPNTSGFMLLRALNAISGTDHGASGITDPLGAGAGELATAFRDANSVRATWLSDPAFGGAAGDELVRAIVDPGARGEGRATGDTIGLSAVSPDGWAISFINSLYWDFGAYILEPETGILFQNRGTSLSLDAGHPNTFVPGKRPRHTLMPVMVFDGDNPVIVPATMGGAAQPQVHTQLLMRLLNGDTPFDATHAPRWIVEEPEADGTVPVLVERGVPETTITAITQAGFDVRIVDPLTEDLGHANIIQVRADGSLAAASDPRSDGSAIVIAQDGTQHEIGIDRK